MEKTILKGWKEIAVFFGVSVSTAQHWDKIDHFVIHPYKKKKCRIYAYQEELNYIKEKYDCQIK